MCPVDLDGSKLRSETTRMALNKLPIPNLLVWTGFDSDHHSGNNLHFNLPPLSEAYSSNRRKLMDRIALAVETNIVGFFYYAKNFDNAG